MGIGRREFLRLTSLAIGGVAVDPLQAVVTTNNVYINKKIGILFHKPSPWGFINVKDFGKLKDSQILGNGWNEIKEEVWEDLGDPVCIATKYYQDRPEYKGLFSPTITLNITPKSELEDLGYESFEELMEMSAYGTSQLLEEFKIIKSYDPYFICGCKFYEYDAEYLFQHIEIDKPLKVELKVLKAEHNGFYYDFNCHQSSAQNQIAHNEFEMFKKSIKLI
ncbi:MAG: hypothetical protein WKF97_19520 [Chitinophagaceae bacterium]